MPDTAAQWLSHELYDWGGANVDVFVAAQRALPDTWLWLPEMLSAVGSYWAAPVALVLMLDWQRTQNRLDAIRRRVSLCRFVAGLTLGLGATALAKAAFALPRPSIVLGDVVYRSVTAIDSRYTFPSGHAVFVGVLAAALWPTVDWSVRIALLLFAATVGWSRIVLGAHFPADVIAGFTLGWVCVVVVSKPVDQIARFLSRAAVSR